MALSIVLVAVGLGVGWRLYARRPRAQATARDPLERALPGVFAFLAARMKFDELYAATLFRANGGLARLADGLDRRVWDGSIRSLARLGELLGLIDRRIDEAGLNAGFAALSERLRGAGRSYARAQTGEIHGYLRALALAFVALLLFLLFAFAPAAAPRAGLGRSAAPAALGPGGAP
jgi:NADH-quinone oxidoreductase subunit L